MKHIAIALLLTIGAAAPVVAETEPPVPIRFYNPDYPQALKDQKIGGIVILSLLIDDHGTVQDAKVLRASNDAFSAPALDAAKKCRFKPAKRDGKDISVRVELPIKFNPTMGS